MAAHHASTLQLFLEAFFTETLTEADVDLDPVTILSSYEKFPIISRTNI
jgi:hypothetical protein